MKCDAGSVNGASADSVECARMYRFVCVCVCVCVCVLTITILY